MGLVIVPVRISSTWWSTGAAQRATLSWGHPSSGSAELSICFCTRCFWCTRPRLRHRGHGWSLPLWEGLGVVPLSSLHSQNRFEHASRSSGRPTLAATGPLTRSLPGYGTTPVSCGAVCHSGFFVTAWKRDAAAGLRSGRATRRLLLEPASLSLLRLMRAPVPHQTLRRRRNCLRHHTFLMRACRCAFAFVRCMPSSATGLHALFLCATSHILFLPPFQLRFLAPLSGKALWCDGIWRASRHVLPLRMGFLSHRRLIGTASGLTTAFDC